MAGTVGVGTAEVRTVGIRTVGEVREVRMGTAGLGQ